MDTQKLLGIRPADPTSLREVKVKLPVSQLLRLHLHKMTSARTFSAIVDDALQEYFLRHRADEDSIRRD
ncbi:MAG TPA: hypothetical protein VFH47_08825 [Candidatus Thermoplasmatota archaeon]|nr:hypothetical protein [Candidatus Thermoplasmatota archaeon]